MDIVEGHLMTVPSEDDHHVLDDECTMAISSAWSFTDNAVLCGGEGLQEPIFNLKNFPPLPRVSNLPEFSELTRFDAEIGFRVPDDEEGVTHGLRGWTMRVELATVRIAHFEEF